ncbi:DsbE family thiol:disulfide interchange protein [uncultured Maritimibacter sp.]|jgi:cytochrome c biogenesis protein CcmG/thiol:disulfide interchange protein DsbE|uniref:DsbE family thiol:disulfide interchange protein n=1 Tax=uncultured Maritimibacter sp. TaxID=991866 RepID=UPI000AD5406A|nr:DsbE family thiol:disulfide interchange protein [uncultured Maritimibacter sp.]
MKPLLLLPVVIFAGILGMGGHALFNKEEGLPSTREGGVAPGLTVSAFPNAESFDAATLADGEVKLVNFWASWCAPCRVEHPQLVEMAEEGVPIYGVNYKDTPENAAKFLGDLGDPFAALVQDDTGRTGLDWGLYGVPETFVIDGDGVVIKRFAGPITEEILDKIIRPAMEEAAE